MAESAGKMYALAIVLGLLAIVATVLRLYARRIKQASLSWDDYMILPALVRQVIPGSFLISAGSCEVDLKSAFRNWHSRLHDYR